MERPLSSAPFRTREKPREKLRRSIIDFDRFPLISSRRPSSSFCLPRFPSLPAELGSHQAWKQATVATADSEIRTPSLLIDPNFSILVGYLFSILDTTLREVEFLSERKKT